MSKAAADSFARLMAPAIAEAKATYPQARQRYLAGLSPGYRFAVTMRLRDDEGRTEQVFLAVDSIRHDLIHGRIASDIALVRGYAAGQPHAISEDSVLDWTILDPQGNEEGNFVGKFIDDHHARERSASVGTVPFRFATVDSAFAVIGDFTGEVRVTRDSVEVLLRSGTATAHRDMEVLTDVTIRAALAFRTSEADDWAIVAMADSVSVSSRLVGGEKAALPSARFVMPRPPWPLAASWLVFRFEAVAHTAGRPPQEFAAYAHADTAMFFGYK